MRGRSKAGMSGRNSSCSSGRRPRAAASTITPMVTRRAIISMGRKNAKTTLAACLAHLCGPPTPAVDTARWDDSEPLPRSTGRGRNIPARESRRSGGCHRDQGRGLRRTRPAPSFAAQRRRGESRGMARVRRSYEVAIDYHRRILQRGTALLAVRRIAEKLLPAASAAVASTMSKMASLRKLRGPLPR